MPYEVVCEPGTTVAVHQYLGDFLDATTKEKIGEKVKTVILESGDVVEDNFLPQHVRDGVDQGTVTMLVKVEEEVEEAPARGRRRKTEELVAKPPVEDPLLENVTRADEIKAGRS